MKKMVFEVFVCMLLIGICFFVNINTVSADTTDSHLVAYWKFDEGSGAIAADSSGNGNNGVIHGATWTSAGKLNSALKFNGINNWVEIQDDDSLDLTEDFTVICWIYPDIHSGNYGMFLSKHQPFINSDHSWYWGSEYNLSTFVNWPGPVLSGAQNIQLNSWTHVAVTFNDTTNIFCFYNNGQLDKQITIDIVIENTNKMLTIGSENGETNFYNGLIDEVRIYNRALTSSEIQNLYNQGNENEPPIVGFAWAPSTPTINQQITFNASVSNDPDGSITKYEWDWNNDGTYEEFHSTPTATHSWDQVGSYPVKLQVTDNGSVTSTKTLTVFVSSGDGGGTNNKGTPGFELVCVVGAIAVVMFLYRKKLV
jgi:hypothetical protein